MSAQVDQTPHPVAPTRRTAQEVVRLPLGWLAEVESCKRRGRWLVKQAATARDPCTTNMTAHRLLLFASDHAFHGWGPTRAMGSRFAPGAFLLLGLVAPKAAIDARWKKCEKKAISLTNYISI